MSSGRKIILISIDTLRADHLGGYGYKLPTSPFLDSLAREGALFERHYATDVPTPPSYTALFSGYRGIKSGILGFGQDANDLKIKPAYLAEHFADAGYRTGMISNMLYPMPWLVGGFQDICAPGLKFQRGLGEEVTHEAGQWLASHGNKDFFLFIHYWEPHAPYYKAPRRYQKMFKPSRYKGKAPNMKYINKSKAIKAFYNNYHLVVSKKETRPERLLAWYDSEIRYVDDCIKKLFKKLEELDIKDEVLVVITSDHGESFGEYGFFDHHNCYQHVTHIPLIFWGPGQIKPRRRVGGISEGIDVMPTLLQLAGMAPPKEISGRSLVKVLSGRRGQTRPQAVVNTVALVIQRMYIEDDWALVHTLSRPGYGHIKEYELFDLKKDKAQVRDVSSREKGRFKKMRLALSDWLAKELNGAPDPLHPWVENGGWAWIGVQRILASSPDILLADPELKRIFIKKFGLATRWLGKAEFEYERYYPGI